MYGLLIIAISYNPYLITNSSPNHITITISRLYNAESIRSSYSLPSIVENTLRPKHKNTITNLKIETNIVIQKTLHMLN